MLDFFLTTSFALLLGQLAPLAPGPIVITTTGLVILAHKRLSWPKLAWLLALFFLGSYRASHTLQHYEKSRTIAHHALGSPESCGGMLRITSSPMQRGDRFSLLAETIDFSCEGKARVEKGTLLRLYAENDNLCRGEVHDVVVRLGTIEIPRNFEVEGGFAYAAARGATLSGGVLDSNLVEKDNLSLGGWIDHARNHARRRIQASYPQDAAPMARALVLGENDLPEQDAEAFRLSGLSHLLAVSGTHVIIAVFGLVRLIEAIMRRIEALSARLDVGRVAGAIGIPLAWAYAEFAGSGGSVRRAALMATAVLGARALARHPNGPRSFGLSLFFGGLMDPLSAFDVSFGLSAGATAGLLIASRPLETKLRLLPIPFRWAAAPVSATVASSTFCLPWLMLLGPKLSAVGIAANVFAVPVGELISLPACLAHLLFAPFPTAERGIALLGSGSLLVVRGIARYGAAMDTLAFHTPRPTDWQLCICALGGASLLLLPKHRLTTLALATAFILLAELKVTHDHSPSERLRITIFDVGQGDSILIDFPDGRNMLIDGGGVVGSPVDPGLRVVAPVLRARRKTALSLVMLSHPHPDHFIGLASTVPTVNVAQFWDTGQGEREGAGETYAKLLANIQERQIPIRRPKDLCGKVHEFGKAQLRVLSPCPDITPGRNANDNSFVVKVQLGERSALLMGDAERQQESEILQSVSPHLLRSDLLKIGHHGSKTSSSKAFLDAVNPSDAVMTSGVRNRYGHPAPETMASLRKRGIRIHRSDMHGAVQWETDGQNVTVTRAVGAL